MADEQDTRQNTELKKSVVQSISLCLSFIFLYILRSKPIKTGKKNLTKQKKKTKTKTKTKQKMGTLWPSFREKFSKIKIQ